MTAREDYQIPFRELAFLQNQKRNYAEIRDIINSQQWTASDWQILSNIVPYSFDCGSVNFSVYLEPVEKKADIKDIVLEYRGHVRQDIGWLVQLFPFNPNNPAHPDDQIVSDANQQNLVGRALKSVFIFANIDDLYHINAYGGHGIYTFSKKLCDILTPFGVKMKALCQWCDKNKGESLENYLVKLQDYAKHY